MAKFYHNKRINKDLIKNKSNQNELHFKKRRIISSKSKTVLLRKKLKKSFKAKNISTSLINNNNENILYNNYLNYSNIYNNNNFKDDICYVMRCYECSFIPLVKIKYSQINIIQNNETFSENNDKYAMVQLCCSKGHNITTTLKKYLINCKINHNFLSLCGECHESKSNELFNFSYCKICKKTLCVKCSESHTHTNKNENMFTNLNQPQDDGAIQNTNSSKNKNLIAIYEIDFYCLNHKKEFIYFCKECNSNLCKECEINHNKLHKKILLNDIKLNEEEIKSIEYNIDLSKKRMILFDIKILSFIQTLTQLEKIHQQLLSLYNFFITIYKDQISFSEVLLSIYKDAASINKFNFQIIQNVRNLKFNIRGIPIKNSYDFSTNIKSLTSYLTNNKNFLLLDIKNYYSNKKIVKARIRAAAKRIRSKIYLNSLKIHNNTDNNEKKEKNEEGKNEEKNKNLKDNLNDIGNNKSNIENKNVNVITYKEQKEEEKKIFNNNN